MQEVNNHTGWFVAIWGWVIGFCPNASTLLIYLSIVVAILQIIFLIKKTFFNGNRGE